MEKLIYVVCVAFTLLFFSCGNKELNQETQILFKPDNKELNPIFLNVIDSFIKMNNNPEYDVFIDIFSNVGVIYFSIKDIHIDKKSISSHFLYYKGKKIIINTALDELMIDKSLHSEKAYTLFTRRWYVELKENVDGLREYRSAIKDYTIQRIDTSGLSWYGIKFVEPIIRDE